LISYWKILPRLVLFKLLYKLGNFNLIFIKDYMENTSYFEWKGETHTGNVFITFDSRVVSMKYGDTNQM